MGFHSGLSLHEGTGRGNVPVNDFRQKTWNDRFFGAEL
jgi:hypothetical protein